MVSPDAFDPSPLAITHQTLSLLSGLQARFQTNSSAQASQALAKAIESRAWMKAEALIDQCLVRDPSASLLHEVFGQRVDSSELPPLLGMAAHGAPPELIEKICSHGVPVNQRAPESWQPIPGATAMHLAAAYNQPSLIRALHTLGIDANAPAADGRTPLDIALDKEALLAKEPPCTRELLRCGASLGSLQSPPKQRINLRGCTITENLTFIPLEGAILIDADLSKATLRGANLNGSWYSPHTTLPQGFYPALEGMLPAVTLPDGASGEKRFYAEPELNQIFERGLAKRSPAIQSEARALVAQGGNVRDGCLYLQVLEETAQFGHLGTGMAMSELLPRLLYAHPPGSISELLSRIESSLDTLHPPAEYHPNEAELFALLRHPQDRMLQNSRHFRSLSTAITSIPTWLNSSTPLTMDRQTAHNWGRIGSWNFGFIRWKFDAMREYETLPNGHRIVMAPSLLELYGATFVGERPSDTQRAPDGTRKPYLGKGFAFPQGLKQFEYITTDVDGKSQVVPFDERFCFEFRQSDIKISHPEYGTLLIANMSRMFGRDNYEHPAFFSLRAVGAGMSQEELLSLTPKNLPAFGFADVLNIELNLSTPHLSQRIAALLDGLDALCQDYNRWKCDTSPYTAFSSLPALDGDERHIMVGGYNSPGFRHVIDFIERRYFAANPYDQGWGASAPVRPLEVPGLAFVPRDIPPWVPFSFFDERGIERKQLVITADRLAALKALSENQVDEEQLRETGVFSFLQTGFFTHAELMLVSPAGH